MPEKTRKKTYQKPRITSEKILETAALACGKCVGGNPIYQAACKAYKRVS